MWVLKDSVIVKRAGDLDLGLCLMLNRWVRRRDVQRFFSLISRIGDGVFWYVLMLLLPFMYGGYGIQASLHMILVGLTGLVLYKSLKHRFTRERPFMTHRNIRLGADPLDRHSFPSGHTLHAVGFTIVAVHYFPMLIWLLLPLATLIALSRMVLGLHYPSDVLMGGSIGATLAVISFYLPFWTA